jgi:transcriptional regulator with XRE-family HTH domain
MSSLYIVLRRRLEEMTEWVELGTATMRQARKAKGLSYESASRLIPVSSKTYERWEKRGAVPRPHLALIAEVLGLEIESAVPARVHVSEGHEETNAQLTRIELLLEELVARLR